MSARYQTDIGHIGINNRSEFLQQNIEFNKFLFDFINQLNLEYTNGAIILVEGKKDTNALVSLGFIGKTIEYCNNNNLSKIELKTQVYDLSLIHI